MKDEDKPKEQLLRELAKLRQQNAELKSLEIKRKKAEERMRESEEMYRLVVKTSPDSIVIADFNTKIIELSQGTFELFKLKNADDFVGRSFLEFISPEYLELARINLQKLIKGEVIKNLEVTYIRRDGTCFIGESNATLIKDANGRPKAIFSITRDITNRKLAEEILRKSEQKLKKEVKILRSQIQQSRRYPEIIGNSPGILQVIDLVHQVARTNSTILIYGETGSGKDLVARAIHFNSSRKESPFIIVNCAALPEHLIESELFGYVKGAFTGAVENKKGFFEEADKGTIFLNEIGDIPLRLQGKLLQVLENQQINRLGQSRSIKVDVRIIAATNKDLKQAVRSGSFREDLFYRLNVLPIKIPPLRERKTDISILAKHFLDKYCIDMDKAITDISQEAMDILCQYPYPGNVRELENIIQHSIIMTQGSTILASHLPEELRGFKIIAAQVSLAKMEKQMIEDIIQKCKGNLGQAAEKLGVHRATLWRKMKKLGIGKYK